MQGEVISSAMKFISDLTDDKSFVEIGEHLISGVICGYGTINNRPVCLFAQDSSVNSGAINEKNCEKICNVIDMAVKNGVPIIGIYDSMGTKISESTSVLVSVKKVLSKLASASGVIPEISIVLGSAVGIASFAVSFSDFVFMIDKKSKLFVNGPQSVTVETGLEISSEDLGGARVHSEKSGICHVFSESEGECICKVSELLSYLPDNNLADVEIIDIDDMNRTCDDLNVGFSDISEVISSIADNNKFLEIKAGYKKEIVTGFFRIGGRSAGVIANRNNTLDKDCISKIVEFVKICDAFNIPIVTLTNVEGAKVSVLEENLGLSKSISSLIYAYSDATIPKVNIIVGNAFGGVGLAMGIGADINLAWQNSKISVALPKTAVNIIYSEEISNSEEPIKFREEKLNEYLSDVALPENSVSSLFIDSVIEPSETRKRIISAFELYSGKREHKLPKKHGNMPV